MTLITRLLLVLFLAASLPHADAQVQSLRLPAATQYSNGACSGGSDGDTCYRADKPYVGWRYTRASGTWALTSLPADAWATMGIASTGYRNPATAATFSFEVPTSLWPSAGSLHCRQAGSSGDSSDLGLTSIPAIGTYHNDGTPQWAPIPDPTGNGQTGWFEVSVDKADGKSHSDSAVCTGNCPYRCEPSAYMANMAEDDEYWFVFEFYTFPNVSQGFGAMTNDNVTFDQIGLQLWHYPDAFGGLGPGLSITFLQRTDTDTPVRTIRLNAASCCASNNAHDSFTHTWSGGAALSSIAGGYTGTGDTAFPGNVGTRETFIIHQKLHRTASTAYTKVWYGSNGGALSQIVNSTARNIHDIDAAIACGAPCSLQATTSFVAYTKALGIYWFNQYSGTSKVRMALRRPRMLLNQHQYYLNAGLTENDVRDALKLFAEGD